VEEHKNDFTVFKIWRMRLDRIFTLMCTSPCDLFKAMINKLDMLVEKELQGHPSRSNNFFTPSLTSLAPSMIATPYDAPSVAQQDLIIQPRNWIESPP
jgi:hypothetical protein